MKTSKWALLFSIAMVLGFSGISNALTIDFPFEVNDNPKQWIYDDTGYLFKFSANTINPIDGNGITWQIKIDTFNSKMNWLYFSELGDGSGDFEDFELTKTVKDDGSNFYEFLGKFGEVKDPTLIIALGGTPEFITGSFTKNSPAVDEDGKLGMTPIQAPEPATMILLGFGLIGLAGFGRNRILKKKRNRR